MPRNKPRLLLALYARPKHPGSYHYALYISPKRAPAGHPRSAQKHHVKNTLLNIDGEVSQPWRYECVDIGDIRSEHRLLVCTVIAKVVSENETRRILASHPIYQNDDADQEKAATFTCKTWARTVYEALIARGAVTSRLDWDTIIAKASEFVQQTADSGRWEQGYTGSTDIAILDLLQGDLDGISQ